MSVYKYVSSEAVVRYLLSWALRITPPDQFNDPFELRPRFTGLTEGYFRQQGPQALTKELKAQIVPVLSTLGLANLPAESTDSLADYLLGTLSPAGEAAFLGACQTVAGVDMSRTIVQLRASFAPVIENIWKSAQELLPTLNRNLEERMHSVLPKMIGVLCLSRSGKHPLMWSHYADSHSGALLEFDEGHETFRRRRSSVDEFGFLRTVRYSDTRPTLGADDTEEDSFANLALTKALEWAYEQEVRWLWPLEQADKIVKAAWGEVHLITVPASALRSVTLGCKATDKLVEQVASDLRRNPEAVHVQIKRAHIDAEHFALNYLPLP